LTTTLLDRLRAYHRGTGAERMAPTLVEGLPVCDQEGGCPLYDGKRCIAQGRRPESLCEPAVEAMVALLDDEDAPPPADPALLAAANRALAEQVERLEANATAREGVLRRERELWRKAERERDALRDAALALVALYGPRAGYGREADAAWAALRAALRAAGPFHPHGDDMNWLTLPFSNALVLLTDDGRPALMRLPVVASADAYALQEAVHLEVEAVTGWRVETRPLTGTDNPRGWWLVVEWVGRLAVPCDYDQVKQAPVDVYAPDPKCECCKLTGMAGLSTVRRLAAEWRGHPAGSYLVWASHPGALGVVRGVGWESTLLRLAMDRLPEAP